MNYAETFDQFASRVGPTDLALYGGCGIVLWILFKDKLSPVQKFLTSLVGKLKGKLPVADVSSNNDSVFFDLVTSWKQTRDLAEKGGCSEAVKIADQMFPHLSPNVCGKADV